MEVCETKMNGRQKTWLFVLPWSLHHAGGVNEVVLNLYRQFAQNENYRPLVLILDWSAKKPSLHVEEGCEVLRFRLRPPPQRWRDIVTWFCFGLRELYLLWRILRSERVSVVNVHYPGVSAFPLAVLKAYGLFRGSLVLSVHGQDLTTVHETSGRLRSGYEYVFRHADSISACSNALAQSVASEFRKSAGKVFVLHNGIDASLTMRESLVPSGILHIGEKYIINIATYEPKKGQDVLIRSFSMVQSSYPDYQLVLIGRDNGTKQDLLNLAVELKIREKVHILGALPHSSVMGILKSACVMVVSSRSEPFGIVVLEAGILGVPVIATRVGGLPEIICADTYGTLVDPDDPRGLAKALSNVFNHPDIALTRANALRKRVSRDFSWESACETLQSCASLPPSKSRR